MGLPDALGELGALQELSIYSCMLLQELPPSITRLAALETLDLNHNCYLAGLSEDAFAGMGALRKLSISMCTTMRTLPRSLVQATNLEELHLLHNRE
jgi:Leucine-rich repeat (LRR) protein